ncbi:stabilizer of axonemal microtubules 1-like isoform X2 [Pecten maximus]|uniref:stabilizer of axonemal microtubules 1-like isoform X2 n=1 Tax=Pecten maximus TaxID=6579 RepID=UPI0014589469|nr:stabilizer of axonemal microtubules 1-like isoform X2 [Pecten maximus]
MVARCICEICTCGRHRCPHRPTNVINKTNQPCNLTEYTNVYKQHPMVPRESFKPVNEAIRGEPFMDATTQRQDYIKHPMEKPFVRVQDQYKKPDGVMDNITSYKKDYIEKRGAPARPVKLDGHRQVTGKFEGEPTYKSDFKKWDLSGRVGPVSNTDAWERPNARFEGESTMHHDYMQHAQPRRGLIKPTEATRMSDQPFFDRTDYRDSYIKHPMEKRFVHATEGYKPPKAAFDGQTTSKRDYLGHTGEKTQSFKPEGVPFQSDAPLEDSTTNRNDYKKWPAQRPYYHAPDQYKAPEGKMESNTTHNATYRQFPIQRSLAKRPDSANKARNAAFDGSTSYANDYIKWDMGQKNMPMVRDEYHPTDAPFEGMSTQKAHYIAHPQQPLRSFKPDNTALQSNAKFEDGTMYRTDYTAKKVGLCPAISLDGPTSGFQFTTLDSRGHRVYQPVMETITPLNAARQTPNKLTMSVA